MGELPLDVEGFRERSLIGKAGRLLMSVMQVRVLPFSLINILKGIGMSKVEINNNSLSLTVVLFLIFMVLKLTETIDWSWWWVTCPLWALWVAFGLYAIVLVLFIGICSLFEYLLGK